jgi:hypothetical protein
MPLVAATAADGKSLARVVVLRPLYTAMFHILASKLSGLCGRRVFYLPFSRSLKLEEGSALKIRSLVESCLNSRGILLVCPEHILSFKLAGFDYFCRGSGSIGRALVETQNWITDKARDMLDESDELLSVKYQLVYTIGRQQAIDGQPYRWNVIQQILALVRLKATELSSEFPTQFEIKDDAPHIFPIIRIVDDSNGDSGRQLGQRLADAIRSGQLPAISFRLFPEQKRILAMRFITEAEFPVELEAELFKYLSGVDIASHTILLLRGLFAYNLLVFSIKEKRWRVDYGLDIRTQPRTRLAVPYRAKDTPDHRADFGHPDVALILTCLSYYYGGLTEVQLRTCFELVLKCEDPASEYQVWIRDVAASLPEAARHLNGVNPLDQRQWKKDIYPSLRRCKAVIDFYLSHTVFPREAKEFPWKLTTNSWDLAERRPPSRLTTGFSGTNDNRHLLPLSVVQQDSPEQLHTNALVISNILRKESDHVICLSKSDASSIIQAAVDTQNPPVSVLLDVGAQVLELTNHQVARRWLDLNRSANILAAVYFDAKDEAIVLKRNGIIEYLKDSPMMKQLGSCLVYLDEAHTRGTDLPFPLGSRAMVTLGPKLFKDKLVQGAVCCPLRSIFN